jgi:osmotically-inducible protein OsmY
VTLRGDVFALADIEQLETRVRTIQGVRDVENLLRIKPSRPLAIPHGWTALGG